MRIGTELVFVKLHEAVDFGQNLFYNFLFQLRIIYEKGYSSMYYHLNVNSKKNVLNNYHSSDIYLTLLNLKLKFCNFKT